MRKKSNMVDLPATELRKKESGIRTPTPRGSRRTPNTKEQSSKRRQAAALQREKMKAASGYPFAGRIVHRTSNEGAPHGCRPGVVESTALPLRRSFRSDRWHVDLRP